MGWNARAGGITAAMVLAVGVTACSREEPTPSGQSLYEDHCAVCHGPGGGGDGPAAKAFAVAPPDLTQLAARNGGTFPLRHVMSQIDGYGRGARIHAGQMPEMGHLLDGPLVRVDTGDGILTPTPTKLLALARYLETLQE